MEEHAPETVDKSVAPPDSPPAAPPAAEHPDRPQRVRIKVRVRERIKTKHKRDRYRRVLRFIKDYWRVPGLIIGVLVSGLGVWVVLKYMAPRMAPSTSN